MNIEIVTSVLPNGVHKVVAIENKQVVGSAFYGKQQGVEDFGPIQVNASHRRRGIGTLLIQEIINISGGVFKGDFWPDTCEENNVKAFYEKVGMTIGIDGKVQME